MSDLRSDSSFLFFAFQKLHKEIVSQGTTTAMVDEADSGRVPVTSRDFELSTRQDIRKAKGRSGLDWTGKESLEVGRHFLLS